MAVINVAPYIPIYGQGMMEKRNSDKILQDLAPYADHMEIALSTKDFNGMLFNLRDKGIKLENYKLVGSEEIGEDVSYVCGWQIQYKIME